MIQSLSHHELAQYLSRQVNSFFPDPQPVTVPVIKRVLPGALDRLHRCLGGLTNAYFYQAGKVFFNHLHSEQYAMFLYLLANEFGRAGNRYRNVAAKFYLLNKALHGLEAYYEIELPEVFWFAHPVGTVLGRAKYGNYFAVMQCCSVGNIDGVYPVFGERVVLCSNSSVLGASVLGDGACVGAGSLLLGTRVPANQTAVGRGDAVRFIKKPTTLWRKIFRCPEAATP